MLYDFTARMHEDDIVYIHQRAGIALKTKYSPLVDILLLLRRTRAGALIFELTLKIEPLS